MISRTQIVSFMKEFMSFHQPISWTSLKNLTPMSLSIGREEDFILNLWMEFMLKNHQEADGIGSLMQW